MLQFNDSNPVLSVARKFGNVIVVGCVGTIGGTAIGIYRLRRLYDDHELLAAGVAIIAISACGRYAIGKTRAAIRGEETPIKDFIDMVRQFFGAPKAVGEIETEGGEWVERMVARYKPGRSSYALPVGLTENGQFVEVSMEESESQLIVQGASGFGKSYLINQMVLAAGLTGLYQVIIIGKTVKDYYDVLKMRNVYGVKLPEGVKTGEDDEGKSYPEKLLDTLNSIYMQMCERQRFLEDKGVSKMADVRKRDRPQSVLIVIDEFSNAVLSAKNLSTKISRQIQGRVTQIAQEGRAVNMHLLLVGQRAAAVIDPLLRGQMVSIVYRQKNAEEGRYATGSKEAGAHNLIVGDPKKGKPHQIVICDERRNRYSFVPATPTSEFKRLAALDKSDGGDEPFWVDGYESPRRTESVPEVEGVVQMSKSIRVPVLETEIKNKAESEDTSGIIAKAKGTDTAGTVSNVRNWATDLFDSHADYSNPPARLTRDRVVEIALCGFVGLSENATMRAVFNGKKPDYRNDVKAVFAHMVEAGFVVA